VTQETGSTTDLALVLTAATLPMVGLLLLGGVWADRLPRQRVMVATDLARFVLHGLLAVLILTTGAEIWQVMVIEAFAGAAAAFFQPAYSGLVPQTVPEAEIQTANAFTAGSANLAELVGPALATALVLGLGAGTAFAVDACTFLVSAALLLGVRGRSRGAPAAREPLRRELAIGWREVRSRAWVWATIAAFSVMLFSGLAPFYVLGPVIAEENWGSIGYYGVASALIGGGTVVGAVVGLRIRPRRPMRTALLCAIGWPVVMLIYSLGAPLAVVYVTCFVAGVGLAVFDVLWLTALAERIPPAALSRVSSYDWMGSLALLPLGYLVAGVLATVIGPVAVGAAGAAVGAVALALALSSRSIRTLPAVGAPRQGEPVA
jgi:MFS family permease